MIFKYLHLGKNLSCEKLESPQKRPLTGSHFIEKCWFITWNALPNLAALESLLKLMKPSLEGVNTIEGNVWMASGFSAELRGSPRDYLLSRWREGTSRLSWPWWKKWIHPGSTIHSDCWKSYDCLAEEGYLHHTVNHSENFINPVDGTHTNNIERVWRDIRFTIPRFGVSKDHFPGYLAEFLFKREFRKKEERMHHFFIAAANLYPPNCWSVYYSPLIPAIRMRLLCIITKE